MSSPTAKFRATVYTLDGRNHRSKVGKTKSECLTVRGQTARGMINTEAEGVEVHKPDKYRSDQSGTVKLTTYIPAHAIAAIEWEEGGIAS